MDKTDQLSRRRYMIVSGLAITYLIGQLASLTFMGAFTGMSDVTLEWIDNISFALFVLILLIGGWTYIRAERQDAETFSALNDELSKHHARTAAIFAFKCVFALSLVLFLLAKTTAIAAEDVAKIVLTTCLVAAYLRFAWLELKHG